MTDLPHLSLYRRATVFALVVAPLLFLADNLLHPKEWPPNHEAVQLREIAAHYGRWQGAHVLGLASIFLFTAGVLGLAFLLRRRDPLLGLAGGVLAVAGLLGFAAAITIDGFSWGVVGEVSHRGDPRTAALVLKDLQHSKWVIPYYLPALGFLLGLVILAIGLARARAVPTWSAFMFGLAGVLAGLEGVIHSNGYFIAGAVVLLVGSGSIGLSIAAMSDEEFARGGPGGQAGIGSSASAP